MKLTAAQVREIITAAHSKGELPDLHGRDLSLITMDRDNLSGADLSEADLCEANFTNADLSQANLFRADLRGTKLRGTNLHQTKMDWTNKILVIFKAT